MGTTQRIIPGVTGEPNWGSLSRAITGLAKTVEDESKLDSHVEDEKTPEILENESKQFVKIIKRREKHLQSTFDNLIRTGGGKSSIISGRSKSFGKGGRKSAIKISSFFSGVSQHGVERELNNIGFGSLVGKSVDDIINHLLMYMSDDSSGMDEVAASKASCEVFDEIIEETGDDVEKFEDYIKNVVDNNLLENVLCRFFGFYIFEHLSQRFVEKIDQQKGKSISMETFSIIKEDILGRIEILNTQKSVKNIDWSGKEGHREIENIFESIINIISNDD
ncbi:hypothetical protein [Wenyingzhuangia aestuarii]|uniref:hypothetical protein n=1 Tax=Wenyingzhuangia aestuarii TaxID=1647582 RepID=UPI00143AE08B|nr:hypothetical protein [Wenyingzhuangia aestuarii]NJB83591.1 hypothetical protein [Wenyingzhuangia aestuarii]